MTEEKPCGCAAANMPTSEAWRPSRVTALAEEPLLALYEEEGSEEANVYNCGPCAQSAGGSPTTFRMERFRKNNGAYEIGTEHEFELSKHLKAEYEFGNRITKNHHACLPWVRVTRDPNNFTAALAAARKLGPVTDSAKFAKLVSHYMIQQDQEGFYVLLLDTKLRVRGISEISRGARDRVMTPIPDVLRLPLIEGAMAFIVAHNHPSGDVKPSQADKEITKAIKQGADAVNVMMLDHVIIGTGGYFSFYDKKLI